MKRFLIYALRWQLSTPVLAIFVYLITNEILATFIANCVGAIIFFFIDKFIFTSKFLNTLWEIKKENVCFDCGRKEYGFRLVLRRGYDKTKDEFPEYRCYKCAIKKAREDGVEV